MQHFNSALTASCQCLQFCSSTWFRSPASDQILDVYQFLRHSKMTPKCHTYLSTFYIQYHHSMSTQHWRCSLRKTSSCRHHHLNSSSFHYECWLYAAFLYLKVHCYCTAESRSSSSVGGYVLAIIWLNRLECGDFFGTSGFRTAGTGVFYSIYSGYRDQCSGCGNRHVSVSTSANTGSWDVLQLQLPIGEKKKKSGNCLYGYFHSEASKQHRS